MPDRGDPHVARGVVARGVRVLMVNDYATASGGAELQMLTIRDRLRRRGHDVRLFASDARLVEDFDVLAERPTSGRTDRLQALTQTVNVAAWRDLGDELRIHPPDIVHIRMFLWQLSPLVLSRLADVPVLYQAAVYKAVCPTGLKLLPDGRACSYPAGRACRRENCVSPPTWVSAMAQLRLLERWRRHIDQVAVLSRRMGEVFASNGWPDVSVLGNGIDLRPMVRPLADRPLVVYAGRLSREKGVEVLLDAFTTVVDAGADADLVIAGTGPLDAELRRRASPLGARVRFLGHLRRDDMEDAFARAWVQVVPSVWDEPFGNVTTEAMARGTAVVASDVGGQSDLVRDGTTGYLVPPGDADALARRLTEVVDDGRLADRLGSAGHAIAREEHAWDPVLDRLEMLYATTIESHRNRPPHRPLRHEGAR